MIPADHEERTTGTPSEAVTLAILVSMITSEGHLIWARFTTLVVTNSIVLGFIGASVRTGSDDAQPLVVAGSVFGLVMIALWSWLTWRGFAAQDFWFDQAKKADTLGPNPFALYADIPRSWLRRPIRHIAYGVIGLFLAGYSLLLIDQVGRFV